MARLIRRDDIVLVRAVLSISNQLRASKSSITLNDVGEGVAEGSPGKVVTPIAPIPLLTVAVVRLAYFLTRQSGPALGDY